MSTSTVATVITGMFTDIGTLVALGVGLVLGIAVSLLGLAFGWKRLKKYITGKGF